MWSMEREPPSLDEVWNVLLEKEPSIGHYTLVQVHGQRKLFNPRTISRYTPPEGNEVFVGRIPRDLYEDELLPPFLKIGVIHEMRMMMNFSGTTRGFAFVMFENRKAAHRAVEVLNNHEIRPNQFIGVVMSKNNRRLHIGGLIEHPSLKNILWHYLHCFTEGVVSVRIFRKRDNNGMYALVEYSSHRAAAMARRILIPHRYELFKVFGPNFDLDWAHTNVGKKQRIQFRPNYLL